MCPQRSRPGEIDKIIARIFRIRNSYSARGLQKRETYCTTFCSGLQMFKDRSEIAVSLALWGFARDSIALLQLIFLWHRTTADFVLTIGRNVTYGPPSISSGPRLSIDLDDFQRVTLRSFGCISTINCWRDCTLNGLYVAMPTKNLIELPLVIEFCMVCMVSSAAYT